MLRERMLLMHAAFANVAFDGNTLATLRGLVSQRKRDGHIGPRAAIDCEATIQPMDISPIRSPLAVHTMLARRFAGRDVVEIGTRMGDAIACFALVARSAVAVELMPKYCKALANRTSRANIRTGSFRIACGDYRNASLDADYITWWQQAPGLVNQALLSHLHQELLAGRMRAKTRAPSSRSGRPTATATLWSGSSWSSTMSAPCARSVTGSSHPRRRTQSGRPATVRRVLLRLRAFASPSMLESCDSGDERRDPLCKVG